MSDEEQIAEEERESSEALIPDSQPNNGEYSRNGRAWKPVPLSLGEQSSKKRKYTKRKISKAKPENKKRNRGKFKGLNPRQQRFVVEYAKSLQKTQAYKIAFRTKTDSAAAVGANTLLRNPLVQIAVLEEKERRRKRIEITGDRIALELARVGFSDVRSLYNQDGSLKPVHELDDDAAAAVSTIKVTEEFSGFGDDRVQVGVTKEIRRWDKNAALEKLAKMTGILKERQELNVTGQIDHNHQHVVKVKDLGLSLEQLKVLRDSLRAKQLTEVQVQPQVIVTESISAQG